MKLTDDFAGAILETVTERFDAIMWCQSLYMKKTVVIFISILAITISNLFICYAAALPGFERAEFIYQTAPFPECHASTIEETPNGLIAAWFGGSREKGPDVGIWISRCEKGSWTPPVEVANGIQHKTKRYPCWNPVLILESFRALHVSLSNNWQEIPRHTYSCQSGNQEGLHTPRIRSASICN